MIWFLAAVLLAGQAPRAAQRAAEGLQALEAGRLDAAEKAFGEARQLDPANVNYSIGLAQTYVSAGRSEAAIPLLKECLRKLPRDYDLRITLAQTYLNIDQDANAARVLEGKAPPEPRTATWLFFRGFALFRLNNYAAALPIFEQLLRYRDMQAPGNFFVANCRAAMGDLVESLPFYARAIEKGNRSDNRALNAYYHNYGLALFRLSRYEEASKQFQESSRLYSADPLPRYFLGRSLAELKRYGDAIQALESAIEVRPDFTPAYYRLATMHQQHGDRTRAAQLFRKVAEFGRQELDEAEQRASRIQTGTVR